MESLQSPVKGSFFFFFFGGGSQTHTHTQIAFFGEGTRVSFNNLIGKAVFEWDVLPGFGEIGSPGQRNYEP